MLNSSQHLLNRKVCVHADPVAFPTKNMPFIAALNDPDFRVALSVLKIMVL